jgi:hypothetical protein
MRGVAMKSGMAVIVFMVVLLGAEGVLAAHSLSQVWKADGLAVPESVIYINDPKEPYLLVSQIDGEPAGADQKGGIAKLAVDGTILDLEWITGLNAPKGMGTDGKLLYVADITELVVIDLKKKKITKKIPVPDAAFLNDVTVSSSGVVYISDSQANKVYALQGKEIKVHLENVKTPNGLAALGSSLVVGSANRLQVYDQGKPFSLAKGFAQDIDGVVMTTPGEFLVSCWAGMIYYVNADGSVELLLDSRVQQINTADLGYDPTNRMVFVPNFFKNSVTAYQLK